MGRPRPNIGTASTLLVSNTGHRTDLRPRPNQSRHDHLCSRNLDVRRHPQAVTQVIANTDGRSFGSGSDPRRPEPALPAARTSLQSVDDAGREEFTDSTK